jgi:predicted  nucleic acid-binding Zn-ribbon protein
LKNKMKLLIQLQDCDNKINEIISKKREGPLRIKRLQEELDAFGMRFKEDTNRLESLRKDRRRIEQEIQEFENKIEKSAIKLDNIKSNKEYKAALKEIEDLKKGKFLTEEKTIQLMEEIEELEKRCLENKDSQTKLELDFKKDNHEIEQELRALDRDLKKLEEKGRSLSEAMDRDLLKRYLFIKERKGGQAISPVIGGVCQSCHLGIPPQKFNELIRGDDLMTCPNCNRMMYWGDDEHFQKGQKGV